MGSVHSSCVFVSTFYIRYDPFVRHLPGFRDAQFLISLTKLSARLKRKKYCILITIMRANTIESRGRVVNDARKGHYSFRTKTFDIRRTFC